MLSEKRKENPDQADQSFETTEDQELDHSQKPVRKKQTARVQSTPHKGSMSAQQEADQLFIERLLHNDQWAKVDLLGYELYATAIKEIITHEDQKTRPPLTIAIQAPWGQGKTTLMRYVERECRKLRESLKEKNSEIAVVPHQRIRDEIAPKITFGDLKTWLAAVPEAPHKLAYPTVWFNPWKYQSRTKLFPTRSGPAWGTR